MKNLFYLLFLFSSISFAQEINGLYRSNLTLFRSQKDPEKNFTNNSTEYYITIDIYDSPYTRGNISIISKSPSGESVTLKFITKGDKKYLYEDGETYLTYDSVISLLNVETNRKCQVAINVDLSSLIVIFEGGATQLWDLKKI